MGGFPPLWTEWNGKYRDTVRDFWRGEPSSLAEFASRLTGSSDLYGHSGRRPIASINFVTAHDGFTLTDLVSYNEKRNEANGEGNADGESHNSSWNCGAEGPTDQQGGHAHAPPPAAQLPDHPAALPGRADDLARRRAGTHPARQQQRLLPGQRDHLDRLGPDPEDRAHLDFTRQVVQLRKDHATLRRRRFFHGAASHGGESEIGDVAWFTPAAEHMTEEDWNHSFARSVMVFLNGDKILEPDERGERIIDDSLLILLNADGSKLTFDVPSAEYGPRWSVLLDTDERLKPGATFPAASRVTLEAHSVVVLSRPSLEA